MTTENLIYHSKIDGYASYGRDGGAGRDIVIGPSVSLEADQRFLSNIASPLTSVVTILDNGPDDKMVSALDALSPVWNLAPRGTVYAAHNAETMDGLREGFANAAMKDFKRQRLPVEKIDPQAFAVLEKDIHESLNLFENMIDKAAPVSFRMVYYPPASQPIRILHNWHNDSVTENLIGKIRLQRSVNVDGLRFAFKEQAFPEMEIKGVGFSTGHVVFNVTPDNIHKAPPVSPDDGRIMYLATATPRFA